MNTSTTTRIPVVCSVCDPPSTVYVLKGTVINDPYICTTCQLRALRRLERATNPYLGRLAHGTVV